MLGQTNYHLLLQTDYSNILKNKQFLKNSFKILNIFYFDSVLAKPLVFFGHTVYVNYKLSVYANCKLPITVLVEGTRQVYESMEKEHWARDVKKYFFEIVALKSKCHPNIKKGKYQQYQ